MPIAGCRMIVRMIMVMMVTMMVMVIIVTVAMTRLVIMAMTMLMVMDALVRPPALRVFAEHQRLDGDRHRIGRHADAPEVDVVEVAQHHAVDGKNLAFDMQFLAQDGAERLGNVAVEHDE